MTRLCKAAAVAAGQVVLARLSQTASVLVLRTADGAVIGYRNACPHMGIELDWEPKRLLTGDGKFLRCTGHGALFKVETGECTRGPCLGEVLTPVSLRIEDGAVVLDG